jgi:GH18 family chitinase
VRRKKPRVGLPSEDRGTQTAMILDKSRDERLAFVRDELDLASAADGRIRGNHYSLSIASADGEYFDHTEMSTLHTYLDWINVMTYDFFNSLTLTTGHHAGLYKSAAGSLMCGRSTEASVNPMDAYDDPQSIRAKVQYVKAHHLGGMMFWELSEDRNEELLDVIVRSLH